MFLNSNFEALVALLLGWGSLAIELVKGMLDGMPTFKLNTGAFSNFSNTGVPAMEGLPACYLDLKFLGLVKCGFKFIEELEKKSVGMGEAKKMATFMLLGGIATASWYEHKDFKAWEELEESF